MDRNPKEISIICNDRTLSDLRIAVDQNDDSSGRAAVRALKRAFGAYPPSRQLRRTTPSSRRHGRLNSGGAANEAIAPG
jgi:hypothetical protein